MSKTVDYYTVPPSHGQPIVCEVRAGGRVVHIGIERDVAVMFIESDPAAPDERRTFKAFATGEVIPDGWQYVGTTGATRYAKNLHIYEQVDIREERDR